MKNINEVELMSTVKSNCMAVRHKIDGLESSLNTMKSMVDNLDELVTDFDLMLLDRRIQQLKRMLERFDRERKVLTLEQTQKYVDDLAKIVWGIRN